jgi:drug/metabolite transporter (DMT)-like permease
MKTVATPPATNATWTAEGGARRFSDRPELSVAESRPALIERRLLGIGLMVGAVLCFAGLDACAKWVSRSVDPLLTTWMRYLSGVVFVSIAINPWTHPGVSRANRPLLQATRSILLLLTTVLNFLALQHLQLTQTVSIQFGAPLLVALLSGPMLGEWLGWRRMIAVGIGFLGILIVTRPGTGSMHPAALYSVVGAVCYALYAIATRVLAAHDSTATTLFYSGLSGLVLMAPVVPFVWTIPTPGVAVLMAATGLLGSVGHWLMILAHARAPAPVLAPFIYTQILWMVGLGYLVFGDVPDRWTVVGASVVVGSGLYLLLRSRD